MHFGKSGDVDRWGSRTEEVITQGVIVVGLVLLFWVLTILVPRMPETLLNIPARDKQWWLATPERREELNRRLVHDIHVMGTATLLLVASVGVVTMAQTRLERPSLGPWFTVLLAVYLVGVLGYSGYLIAVRYRSPGTGTPPERGRPDCASCPGNWRLPTPATMEGP